MDNGFPILDLPVSEAIIARDCRNAINNNNDLLQAWLKENKLMLQKEITDDIYYVRERSLKSLLFFKNTYESFDEAFCVFIFHAGMFLVLTLLTALISNGIFTLISHIITGFTVSQSFIFVLAGLLIFMLTIFFKKRFYTL